MGIPAAFRWLSNKYPKIVSPVVEELPLTMEDGTVIPVDATRPNPNGEEFDNLYLDMNGIVHPCSHPEDKPAPEDEEEMMIEIFKYTERVVNMVRPRKLLMIAVDGVAPRAKMNQQRSRRFRAAQEAKEKEEDKEKLLVMLKQQNGGVLKAESTEAVIKKAFDSNSITPGTPFMDILAASLRYWCAYKLNTDPAWAKMKVIISDATVPGEGEHKIMNFVRSQRNSPEHDPNTRHVIYGLDADLIMLGLATHEPHFRVLREDVFFQDSKARMCKLCGQKGHDASSCRGETKEKDGEHDEKDKPQFLKPFIWLHVSIFREYLAVELNVPGLPFKFDLERAIDDWVFMCFFVGNDFLPHLPALEIREGGIDTLIGIWKDNLPQMGGYVTKDGHVDLERAQFILAGLAKQEDAIFRKRKEVDERREAGFKRRKLQQERENGRNNYRPSDRPAVPALPAGITHDMVVNRKATDDSSVANKSAASVLRAQIQGLKAETANPSDSSEPSGEQTSPASALGKRKAELLEEDNASTPASASDTEAAEEEAGDSVRLWEEGYQDRYYQQKFHVDPSDIEFRHKVARAYVEGLAWVLMYYFQGCPSWEWFYPYHYAPFAADFVDLGKMTINFEKGRISRPFEQLMSVLPAASRHAIPEIYHELMTKDDSEIIDFYPEDFEIDLNGKKMAWQGIALLPFIDMPRLLDAMEPKTKLLSADDARRNSPGKDVLLLSDGHPTLYDHITVQFYSKKAGQSSFELDPKESDGLSGRVEKIENYLPHGSLAYPLERSAFPDVDYDRSLSVHYHMPASSHTHKSMLLRGVELSKPALDRSDIELLKRGGQNSGRGGGYRGGSFRGNGRGGRGGNNYGPGGNNGRNDRGSSYQQSQQGYGNGYGNGGGRGGYGGGGGYSDGGGNNRYGGGNSYSAPPPAWQSAPPPPGYPGFGTGLPPPPPAHFAGRGRYNQGYGGGNDRYGAPPPAPAPGYSGGGGRGGGGGGGGGYRGGYQGGNQGGNQSGYQGQQQPRGPPPNGQDRRYDNRGHDNRDNRDRNYRRY
ncbi:XRN 5'-3' exonuclease N-terminus domain containing protein [Rhypophila decipiens]